MIKMEHKTEQDDLMYKLEVAQSKIGREVIARRDTFPDGNGRWFPWFLIKGKPYQVNRVSVNCDEVYFCIERDSQRNPVAVPIEFFRV